MSERSAGGLRSSRRGLWLLLALIAEVASIVLAAVFNSPSGWNGILISVALIILLEPIRRGRLWAWQLFVTLQCVALILIPVYVVLVLLLPGGQLAVDWGALVTAIVALWAVTAPAVRPARPE